MLLNVTAVWVVRDVTNPIQKSFASWNCSESLSPKRKAIMEMRWDEGEPDMHSKLYSIWS